MYVALLHHVRNIITLFKTLCLLSANYCAKIKNYRGINYKTYYSYRKYGKIN